MKSRPFEAVAHNRRHRPRLQTRARFHRPQPTGAGCSHPPTTGHRPASDHRPPATGQARVGSGHRPCSSPGSCGGATATRTGRLGHRPSATRTKHQLAARCHGPRAMAPGTGHRASGPSGSGQRQSRPHGDRGPGVAGLLPEPIARHERQATCQSHWRRPPACSSVTDQGAWAKKFGHRTNGKLRTTGLRGVAPSQILDT